MLRASLSLPLLAFAARSAVADASAGQYEIVGNTLVSAMMMFLGNEEKVYMMDKTEGNAVQINGHPAWASVWDIGSRSATTMDFRSNAFCASGSHLTNGSLATFGGNGAITVGGNLGSSPYPGNYSASYDATYQDHDGTKAIRILNPCTGSASSWDASCEWYDDSSVLAMQRSRWYSTAEALGDGSIALIGGMANGGFINRNYHSDDPDQHGAAENTVEFFPSRGQPQIMPFLRKTSGLNSYAHSFLMPSGKMLIQANYSTMLWDPATNDETDLPDMPNQVVRVYPASGAVAMLPLTPANNYNPTVLFCGGQDSASMSDDMWGDYKFPYADTWNIPASKDCQRLTPEPADGSAPAYAQDDDMPAGRTMGQFIILPTGKLLVLNGARNGTAGYSNNGTGTTIGWGAMPFGSSLASDPALTPALYDPQAAAGKRWSTAGLGASTIPRLYHSSALLLPDGAVLVAGSNPNVDTNLSTVYNTEYRAEMFYPPYYFSPRPVPSGLPKTILYGGPSFDITIPSSSYTGAANDVAAAATVVLVRPGFTTHAMNMGQRYVQLNNTYTVNSDGSLVLHTAQAPPNPNVLTPGPALLFVVVGGVPSNGTMVIVGSGKQEQQPTAAAAALPASVLDAKAQGSGGGSSSGSAAPSSTGAGVGASQPSENAHSGAISAARPVVRGLGLVLAWLVAFTL